MEITDYDAWQPCELNFVLMKLACQLDRSNPFLPGFGRDTSGFLKHLGSAEFLRALQHEGGRINLEPWFRRWHEQDRVYQQMSMKYWLYPAR